MNVDSSFPPTSIVHGGADIKVPIHLSRKLFDVLKENGVECEMVEVPGEDHTFAAKMEVRSVTWNLQRQGLDFLESLIKYLWRCYSLKKCMVLPSLLFDS